ncbi:hypothetical protein CRE_05052 [Caenorhabditis remanei]|uniref:Uncharacterized protein n=1 Tax=Caenorhabditis remanei TaxID=31234 RepID=E3MZ87_CAERE|nr:hypothetical protein CRE_05052 [Caenorhabditis remanei]
MMKTLLLLLALVSVSYGFALGIGVPLGEKDVALPISSEEVKAFTRTLKNGQKQVWNLSGPNKGTWVDSKGKKVPSTNFVFKAPGTLIIKKLSNDDAGVYDYEPLKVIKEEKLPPGVHVDPHQQRIELSVIGKL